MLTEEEKELLAAYNALSDEEIKELTDGEFAEYESLAERDSKQPKYQNLSTAEAQRLKELRDNEATLSSTDKNIKQHLENKLSSKPVEQKVKTKEEVLREGGNVAFPYTSELAYEKGGEASLFDKGSALLQDVASYPGRLAATAGEADFSSMGKTAEEREGFQQVLTSPITGAGVALSPFAATASTLGTTPLRGALAAGAVEGFGTALLGTMLRPERSASSVVEDLIMGVGSGGLSILASLPKSSALKSLTAHLKKSGYPDAEAATLAREAYEKTFAPTSLTSPKISTLQPSPTIQGYGKKGVEKTLKEIPLFPPASLDELEAAASASQKFNRTMREGGSLIDMPYGQRFRDPEQLVDAYVASGRLPIARKQETLNRIQQGLDEIDIVRESVRREVLLPQVAEERVNQIIAENADIPGFVDLLSFDSPRAAEMRLFSTLAGYTPPALSGDLWRSLGRGIASNIASANSAPITQGIGYTLAPAAGVALEETKLFGPEEK